MISVGRDQKCITGGQGEDVRRQGWNTNNFDQVNGCYGEGEQNYSHVEDVHVCRREKDVRDETSDHMPSIECKKASHKIR